jgi:hypothetical protein
MKGSEHLSIGSPSLVGIHFHRFYKFGLPLPYRSVGNRFRILNVRLIKRLGEFGSFEPLNIRLSVLRPEVTDLCSDATDTVYNIALATAIGPDDTSNSFIEKNMCTVSKTLKSLYIQTL